MPDAIMSKKKPAYPVSTALEHYLHKYNRISTISVFYEDLLRFSGSVVVYDKQDRDTLWVRVFYSEFEREEIDINLKKIYTTLHSDGNENTIEFLTIDAVDYCTFGNSKPFRVKVRNVLNDNFTYFYVKKTDASRVYGLELEHLLSPYNLNFLVYKNTLIEEHIAGIPGDVFIKEKLPHCTDLEKAQIAKEFVKFNERAMIRLLGDMRSYNYVVIPIHDFDQVIYKIRAIDFDQQSYEGHLQIYRPQFFKENKKMKKLIKEKLPKSSVQQYKIEERSMLSKRILNSEDRVRQLLKCMVQEPLAPLDHIKHLKYEIYELAHDVKFKRCTTMGQIVAAALDFILRNYKDMHTAR